MGLRWHWRCKLSYRDVEELMAERGVEVDHATLNRWVVKFAPLLLKAVLRPKAPVGTSSRMDEEPSLLARSRSLRSR